MTTYHGHFSESAKPGNKYITSLMYYLIQFWLISFCTWPRAIRLGIPQYPPTKTEIMYWGWQGQGQCQQLSSWPGLIFLRALFLTFPLAERTLFPPNCKCFRGWTSDTRELKIIPILMCYIMCHIMRIWWHFLMKLSSESQDFGIFLK